MKREKEECKKLGGKWDAHKKKWYVPDGVDVELFSKWKISNSEDDKNKNNLKDKKKDEINNIRNNFNEKTNTRSINWSESVLRSKWQFSYYNLGSLPSFVRENLLESLSILNKNMDHGKSNCKEWKPNLNEVVFHVEFDVGVRFDVW